MQRLDRLLLFVCTAGMGLVSACNTPGAPRGPRFGGNGAASDVTSISIGLPNRDNLKTQVADIETKMNGYRLIVKPVDASCAGATSIDEVGDYSTSAKLNASLAQGCDYDVTLELGNKEGASSDTDADDKVAYEGEVKTIINRSCVNGCHTTGYAYGDFSSYDLSKAKGARIIDRAVTKANMPASAPLARSERDLLQAWADGGYLEKSSSTNQNPGTVKALKATYYKNESAKRIAKSDIEGKSSYKASLALQLQADGRAIGLSENGGSTDQEPDPNPNESSNVNLSQERNLNLTTASGGTEKLASVFKGKYMLVDISQETCGYCVTAARNMNNSVEEQKLFDGTKCSHVTLVPKSQLSGWLSRIGGASGFSGKHSYGMDVGLTGLNSPFGINLAGTPAYMMIDTEGKVVAYQEGGMPSEARQLCQ